MAFHLCPLDRKIQAYLKNYKFKRRIPIAERVKKIKLSVPSAQLSALGDGKLLLLGSNLFFFQSALEKWPQKPVALLAKNLANLFKNSKIGIWLTDEKSPDILYFSVLITKKVDTSTDYESYLKNAVLTLDFSISSKKLKIDNLKAINRKIEEKTLITLYLLARDLFIPIIRFPRPYTKFDQRFYFNLDFGAPHNCQTWQVNVLNNSNYITNSLDHRESADNS